MAAGKVETGLHYFPEKLEKELDQVWKNTLTVFVAPAGSGKTTAALHAAQKQADAAVLWITVVSDSTEYFWHGLCNVFAEIDGEAAEGMRSLGFPQDSVTLQEFVRLFHQIGRADKQILLVIDDYHLVDSDELFSFLCGMIKYLPENFHVLVCTRCLVMRDTQVLYNWDTVRRVEAAAFSFGAKDVEAYFALCGVPIEEFQAAQLARQSDGWAALLHLYLLSRAECGLAARQEAIPVMVDSIIFQPLRPYERALLCCASVLPYFTPEDVRELWGVCEDTKGLLDKLVQRGGFLQYSPYTGRYHFHEFLHKCLLAHFHEQAHGRKMGVLKAAGDMFRRKGRFEIAALYYYKSAYYDELMETMEEGKCATYGPESKTVLLRFFEECPVQVKRRHPLAMLIYARKLLAFREIMLFTRACEEARRYILNSDYLSEKERKRLLGEYEYLLGFGRYNNIEKMAYRHHRACELLQGPAYLPGFDGSWMCAGPSMLYMFHRTPGALAQEVRAMKMGAPYFSCISGAGKSGASEMFMAEAHFERGEHPLAVAALKHALSVMEGSEEWGIHICASFLQSRLLLFDGAFEEAVGIIKQQRENIRKKHTYRYVHALDCMESWLNCLAGRPEKTAEWIKQKDMGERLLPFPMVPALYIFKGHYLLCSGQYEELEAISEKYRRVAMAYPNLLALIYMYIQLAGAYEATGRPREAEDALRQALSMAFEDRIYMPFAENGRFIRRLLYQDGGREDCREITVLYDRFEKVQSVLFGR